MKQLYREKWRTKTVYQEKGVILSINDNSNGYGKIKYGITPTETVIEFDEWKDLFNHFGYEDNFLGYKGKKGLWFNFNYSDKYGYNKTKKIYSDDFYYMFEYNMIQIINPSEIRMEQLIKDLSVEEFIEYIKDNGLSM